MMDHGIPLKSFDVYSVPDQGYNHGYIPAYSSQASSSFSVPRKAIRSDAERYADRTALMQPSESIQSKSHRKKHTGRSSFLRWWLPEIFASVLSVACLVCIVAILRVYDRRGLDQVNFPTGLTLNGVIALIATINRVALMVPVGSSLSQEAWLWFSPVTHQKVCPTRLRDLELSDDASRGAWGSLIFLLYGRHRYVSSKSTLNEC